MGMYNVEVFCPYYGEQMSATERRKWRRLIKSVDTACFRAQYSRDMALRSDDPRLLSKYYGRYVRWSDRASAKRLALKNFCDEIDTKYAPKEVAA